MVKLLFLLVIALLTCNVALGNLYQTCSNGFADSPAKQNYYYEPVVYNDAFSLSLPSSSHYSYTLEDGSVIYFNICGPTDICKGAYACRFVNGELYSVYGTLGGTIYYSSAYQGSYEFQMSWNSNIYQTHCGSYSSFTVELMCSTTSGTFNISSVNAGYNYDSCSIYIYAYTPYGCTKSSSAISTYITPKSYSSFSAPIFLEGILPMFSLDHVAVENYEQTFVGRIYTSTQYNSVLINGTLSGKTGSSQVSYLIQGNVPGNPPRLFARVTPPGFSSPVCVLLPAYAGSENPVLDYFSSNANPYGSAQRTYTSVYFNKGTTFNVNTWTASPYYEPFITLQQRTSDNLVVSIGSLPLTTPLVSPYGTWPAFISEINWTDISSSSLPASLFAPPASWNCPGS